MIIGDTGAFAIESGITKAHANLGLRALGFFVIHVGGNRYGLYESNATTLASSFDEVQNRIARRGLHTAPFAEELDAGRLADTFRHALYADDLQHEFFGLSRDQFSDLAYSNDLLWAPDGDETFDDGSYILQFDLGDRVRLIAFKRSENGLHDPFTLRDVWISAEGYSRVLERTNPACWGVLKKRTHRGPLGRERAIQRLGKEYVSPDSIAACSIALIGPAESEIIDNGPDIDLKKVGLINPSLRGGLANGRWHHPGAESQVRAISMNADSERGHS